MTKNRHFRPKSFRSGHALRPEGPLNASFAIIHISYILLAEIFDSNLEIRKKSVEWILKARKSKRKTVRKYELPKSQLDLDYADILSCSILTLYPEGF